MKKINIKIWAWAILILFTAASCSDFLDINENPNQATTADLSLVLPQAIVATAGRASAFNGGNYGAHFGGFMANAGGFSGFGTLLNYNLQPGDYDGLWSSNFIGPLADLKYVIDNSEGVTEYALYNSAAKIIKVVNYQLLVDAFGDVPYTEALSPGNTAPKYDDAAAIYADLIATLDAATAQIDANPPFALALTAAADPLFEGDMTKWKQYANTLKLRMLIRTNGNLSSLAGAEFLEDDAIVNPGYELNRPNPDWASWGRTIAGALSNSSRIPTTFAFGFYNGAKLSDAGRGETIYVNYPNTPTNQLGNEVNNPTIVPGEVTWASNEDGLEGTGILKGPAMGRPLMLLAEAKFLLAEAQLRGGISGDYTDTFYEGITASFRYLYKTESGSLLSGVNLTTLVDAYKTANDDNYLVEIETSTSNAERLEAIITQKYIALNMINSDEAWNEYRRTGYPVTQPGGGPAFDIASNKSSITSRVDRLPTRVMYPSSEQQLNKPNYRNVDYRSELIFWDPN